MRPSAVNEQLVGQAVAEYTALSDEKEGLAAELADQQAVVRRAAGIPSTSDDA